MKGEVRQIKGKRVATPEYRSWQMMKNRCLNPKAMDYARYGGRGIAIYEPWLVFDNFLADMGRRPTPKHTLERKDNDVDYGPLNCVWATRQDQSRNRGSYNKCSLALADLIRKKYATGKYFQKDLGRQYGLTQAHISQIVRNACWKGEA